MFTCGFLARSVGSFSLDIESLDTEFLDTTSPEIVFLEIVSGDDCTLGVRFLVTYAS